MKKLLIIVALCLVGRMYAQETQKDTVAVNRSQVELTTTAKGKPVFVWKAQDGTTKNVQTDKQSAERFRNSGKPYVIYNLNQFGERKISKIYVNEA